MVAEVLPFDCRLFLFLFFFLPEGTRGKCVETLNVAQDGWGKKQWAALGTKTDAP
jgi:hypothetical protein